MTAAAQEKMHQSMKAKVAEHYEVEQHEVDLLLV